MYAIRSYYAHFDQQVAVRVEPRAAAGLEHRGAIELLDDRRPGDFLVEGQFSYNFV